ncbi:alpha/beta-hydrolase [Linnemannia elongata AG-77]|uniref:Alpha/beta-hydrolase n=1 Tax=Linnemannia elongata AG-77 TaxID=1314771 RepID=A0A197JII1_9FUNG|nr:alpha/beta-hydrolase [Linnemannia elongata AG-77]
MIFLNRAKVTTLAIILLPLIAISLERSGVPTVVSAAPTSVKIASSINKRLLVSRAPTAETIDGAHILLKNDVDTSTTQYSFLLLSKPQNYYDAADACKSMSDSPFLYVPGSPAANELNALLKNNPIAQPEVAVSTNFWVLNTFPSVGCKSLNKNIGKTESSPCTTELPIICVNTAPRRTIAVQDTTRQVSVKTAVGTIQGFRDQNSFRFLGIHYGEAPVGKLRFAAPVAKAPFTSTLDATAFGYVCPQPRSATPILDSLINGAEADEDCLNLNVFTPSLKSKTQKGLPVMVYLHGGGYTLYAGSTVLFEPGNLVSRGGVVVVTLNYRLGMLGFTESPGFLRTDVPGNQAIHDTIMALRWVKDHIANFGGDPSRVTVFGESAGAVTIRALLSAPSSWDLYNNVIGQSDPINIPFKPPKDAAELSTYFFEALNCGATDIACARSKPIVEVLIAQGLANDKMLAAQNWTTSFLIERPTVDGTLIPAEFSDLVKSGQFNAKANIMWGTTKDEAGRFLEAYMPVPYPVNPSNYHTVFQGLLGQQRQERLVQSGLIEKYDLKSNSQELLNYFCTEYYFYCPLQYISRQIAAQSTTPHVYNVRFNRGRGIPIVDSTAGFCASDKHICHAKDIIPVFGSGAVAPFTSQTGDDARFARQIIDRWTTFAKTGNPNPSLDLVGVENTNPDVTSIQWEPYHAQNPVLELDLESKMVLEGVQEVCAFYDDELKYDFVLRNPSSPLLQS